MNILIINYEFPPIGGGAGKATYNLAKQLARVGNRVDVLTSRMKGQAPREELTGITVYRVRSWRKGIHDCGFRGAFTFLLFAIFPFRRLTHQNKYDVIHYFFGLPTGILELIPGPHKKIPYIVSLRGSDVPGYDPFNRTLQIAHRILISLTKKLWKGAAYRVALSESLKKMALKTDPFQKIDVIPNGVDPVFFNAQHNFDHKDNGLKLMTVARLIQRKGVQDILKASAELNDSDISLLVVGTGNYENHLKKICKELGLERQVTFYGFCSPEELPFIYRQSDVFILPSYTESFGTVFVEAMSCGLPVIATNIGGIPDYVSAENGILVVPGNIGQIKDAIIKMKQSKQMRTQMGQNNRLKMIEKYSWEFVTNQYISIYQKIKKGTN